MKAFLKANQMQKKSLHLGGLNSKSCKNVLNFFEDKNEDTKEDKPNAKKTSSFKTKCSKNVTVLDSNINGNKNSNKPNAKKMLLFLRVRRLLNVKKIPHSKSVEKSVGKSVENQMYKKGNTLLIKNVF
ncbi:hypothetical protein CAPN002_07420 [Capnocytophaga stomatis]|nr:hypothetical protein CAPN002_07420 [Capnocytophaga stomatis]